MKSICDEKAFYDCFLANLCFVKPINEELKNWMKNVEFQDQESNIVNVAMWMNKKQKYKHFYFCFGG